MDDLSSRKTPITDSYDTCDSTSAALAIYPGDMEPERVTQMLGLAPTQTRKCLAYEASGLGARRMVPGGSWLLSSEGQVSSRDVRRHLDWLLDRIETAAVELGELQQYVGTKMAVSCVWWSAWGEGGPTLWPDQMDRLARLNLECNFDIRFLRTTLSNIVD